MNKTKEQIRKEIVDVNNRIEKQLSIRKEIEEKPFDFDTVTIMMNKEIIKDLSKQKMMLVRDKINIQ